MLGRDRATLLGLLASGLAFAWVPPAQAQQTITDHSREHPVRWQQARTTVAIDPSVRALGDDAVAAVYQAAATWEQALPSAFALEIIEEVADPLGYREGDYNRNTVRFEPHGEPLAGDALAITVLTFDSSDHIVDADIVINGQHAFMDTAKVVGKRCNARSDEVFDLEGLLAHEFGHLLGLSENQTDRESTMYAYSWPRDTRKRDLTDGDFEAIWELYGDVDFDEPGDSPGCSGASLVAGRATPRGLPLSLFGVALLVTVAHVRRRAGEGSRRSA